MRRGGPTWLQSDITLLPLLPAREAATVDERLLPEGRMRSSGLLQVDGGGKLDVLGRLTRLVQCTTLPGADPFAQLLGHAVAPTLAWDAFVHLGR